jgi:hypothetical protein
MVEGLVDRLLDWRMANELRLTRCTLYSTRLFTRANSTILTPSTIQTPRYDSDIQSVDQAPSCALRFAMPGKRKAAEKVQSPCSRKRTPWQLGGAAILVFSTVVGVRRNWCRLIGSSAERRM